MQDAKFLSTQRLVKLVVVRKHVFDKDPQAVISSQQIKWMHSRIPLQHYDVDWSTTACVCLRQTFM